MQVISHCKVKHVLLLLVCLGFSMSGIYRVYFIALLILFICHIHFCTDLGIRIKMITFCVADYLHEYWPSPFISFAFCS